MDDPFALLIGVVLVAIGAGAATVTQRRLEAEGRATKAPLWLLPFGVLIGAGAAIARGWSLPASMAVGALLIPVVGAAGRYLEVRGRRRSTRLDSR